MTDLRRFRAFVEEIANNEVEWEYEDGTLMNDDAKAFLDYIENMEQQTKKVMNQKKKSKKEILIDALFDAIKDDEVLDWLSPLIENRRKRDR